MVPKGGRDGASFLSFPLLLNLTGLIGGNGRCRKDKQETDMHKLRPDVLGIQMEMHSSLVAFLTSLLFTLLLFSISIL
jgi:hypothetical protein